MLRISEVMPNPASGKEWVELTSLDPENAIALDGCTIHDSKSRILTITKATLDPTASKFLVIQFPSSHLNNDGDAVSLYDPSGQLLDTMTYGKTNKGMSFIRYPDITGPWQQTREPTPGSANIFLGMSAASSPLPASAAPSSSTEQTSPVYVQLPTTTKSVVAKMPSSTKPKHSATPPQDGEMGNDTTDAATVYAGIAAPINATTSKKTAKASTATPIYPITFDMLNSDTFLTQRVLLHGTVATPPGFFHNRSFVLQSPDGRGILVTTPANQHQPEFSSSISVVGTIEFDDYNVPTLHIGAKDRWTTDGTSTEPTQPRLVDLLAPSTEDAWSLVQVTGTVSSVTSDTIHLDLDDVDLDVIVRPNVGYRIKQLKPNDIITVTGILDTSGDTPRLMPRHADEIMLVSHAPTTTVASSMIAPSGTSVPGWTPVGAAGGAIAVTEGVKQLQRRRKQKQLEKKMRDLVSVT